MVTPQPPSSAELASLASSVGDIAGRVRQMAEAAAPAGDKDADMDEARSAAADLWEIERLLRTAQRRLTSLSR